MLTSFFTNPWLLYALGAAALPFIIEWLFRRRKRQVELPTLRYLLRNKEQEKIKRQDRWLLILRTAAVFFLVLGLARPLLQQGWLRDNKRHVVVFLDATASMNQQVGVTTAFDMAKKKAADMVAALPKDTEVSVGYLGERAEWLLQGEKDVHTASGRIRALRAGSGAAPMGEGLAWIKEYLASPGLGDAELYIFSDFQQHTWKRQGAQTAMDAQIMVELARGHETYLIDVGGTPTFNFLVTDLEPVEKIVTTGMPVKFRSRIEARGKPPAEAKARVTFLIHDENSLIKDGDKKGDKKDVREVVPGEAPVMVEFEHRFQKPGEYLVEVLLEGDEHPTDNRRLYLCSVPENVNVLVLDPAAGTPAEDSYFLSRAIAPTSLPGLDRVSRFAVKTVLPQQIAFENLETYSAVVLMATNPLLEAWTLKLERYVADGGSAWFFLGSVSLYEYNKLLFKDGKGLLPCRLGDKEVNGNPTLNFAASGHPGVGSLTSAGSGKPGEFSRYIPLELKADGDAESKLVVALSDGKPAIVERRFGRGTVMVFASTAGPAWNDLPAMPEFPMLVQDLLRYLVGNPDARVNLKVGDRFEQPVFVSSQHLLLKCPDGSKARLTPQQRKDRQDAWIVNFDGVNRHGMYEFADVQQEALTRRRFVANPSAEEGDLSRLQSGEFREVYGSGSWDWIGPEKPIEDFVAKLHSVTEMAPAILLLLTCILGLESFLAARFGRRRGEPAP